MAIANVGKIMPMGDSITRGYQNPFGTRGSYREWLQDFFIAADIAYDFVGSEDFARDGLLDGNCQAISGYSLQQVRDEFQDEVTTYTPDYVLLMIGTNNWSENESEAYYQGLYSSIFGMIYNGYNAAEVVVASVPPAGNYRLASTGALNESARNAEYTKMNDAASVIAEIEPLVHYVDTSALLNADLHTSTGDGVHLNKYGHKVVARAFFDKILDLEGIDNATIDNIKRMADVTSINGYGASFSS